MGVGMQEMRVLRVMDKTDGRFRDAFRIRIGRMRSTLRQTHGLYQTS